MKNDFFLFKKAGAHLQYVCNNCAKLQIDCNFVKNDFFLFQKGRSLSQYVCNNCAKFQIDCAKPVGGVDYTTFFWRGWMDG